MSDHLTQTKNGHSRRAMPSFRFLMLVMLLACIFSCAAPIPKWLAELEDQIGAATYEEVVARWGEPLQVSKLNGEVVGIWLMEEVVRPNWSIHTNFRTVVCERYVNKAKMRFDDHQRLSKIEYLPDGKGQRLGEANVSLISSVSGPRRLLYNYNYDDIRRMCMQDLYCSRITMERCRMLADSKKEQGGQPSR